MRNLDKRTLERVEEFIKKYQIENGESPTYREVSDGVGMSSHSMAITYVKSLEAQGRLHRTSSGKIKLPSQLNPGNATLAPLIGSIVCGQPTLAIENIEESFALPRSLFGIGELMMLRASGESMINAGIDDGDLIVIRQQEYADDGEIVVALLNDETTLKRIYRKDGKIILHPENESMLDIVVDTCDIQGVLVGCIKLY